MHNMAVACTGNGSMAAAWSGDTHAGCCMLLSRNAQLINALIMLSMAGACSGDMLHALVQCKMAVAIICDHRYGFACAGTVKDSCCLDRQQHSPAFWGEI